MMIRLGLISCKVDLTVLASQCPDPASPISVYPVRCIGSRAMKSCARSRSRSRRRPLPLGASGPRNPVYVVFLWPLPTVASRHYHHFNNLVARQLRDLRRHWIVARHDVNSIASESQDGLSPLVDRTIILEWWHTPLLARVEPPPKIVQQGSPVIPGFWKYGAHPPVFARLPRVIQDNLASLAAPQCYQAWMPMACAAPYRHGHSR